MTRIRTRPARAALAAATVAPCLLLAAMPASRVFYTGKLAVGPHRVQVRAASRAGVTTIRFSWQVVPVPHPRTVCYLDLAWQNYRPDGSPGVYFPASALGNVYFGFPAERWVDFRQLDALKPMLDERLGMYASSAPSASPSTRPPTPGSRLRINNSRQPRRRCRGWRECSRVRNGFC